LLDSLVSELGVHVRIEDELFYPAVEKVTSLLAISQAEHRAIDDQLAVVLRTDTVGPDFATEVKMLAATLHHHAGEEERLMFPRSHALGEEALEALGTQMEQRKKQLENSTVTQTLRKAKREVLRHV
jgi:hemerythrin superfamily protein